MLGPEHPDTLTARDNLAHWTGQAGDAAGARDQFAALLPMHRAGPRPEHPRTLATRANLAVWTWKATATPGPVLSEFSVFTSAPAQFRPQYMGGYQG